MDREKYLQWVAERDNYPKHEHSFFVTFYTNYEGKKTLHRYFGPFPSKETAKEWAFLYRKKYTRPGFIADMRIQAMCEVL